MRAVDTNVLVRLFTRDDRKQVATAESFVSRGAWVSALVLMEATWVLTAVYDLTHAEIATAIDENSKGACCIRPAYRGVRPRSMFRDLPAIRER